MSYLRPLLGVLFTAATMLTALACGDVYADPPDMTIPSGPPQSVEDASAPTVFPNDRLPQCPTSRPRENSSCNASGSACEYGTSADRQCNTVLACMGEQLESSWDLRPSDPCFSSVCPIAADVASLDGKPCALESDSDGGVVTDVDEAVCSMTDGICACTTGRDGATRHERKWICVRPISVCPTNRPMAGSPCSGGLWCDYGSCAFKRGLLMECKDGVWLSGGAPCQ